MNLNTHTVFNEYLDDPNRQYDIFLYQETWWKELVTGSGMFIAPQYHRWTTLPPTSIMNDE